MKKCLVSLFARPDPLQWWISVKEWERKMTEKIIYDTYTILLPYSHQHWELSKNTSILKDKNKWLENAIPLDVYHSKSKRLRGLVASIYEEVAKVIKISTPSKTKAAIKTILINLWFARFMGKPIKYSRDRSAYTRDRRYGKLFFKYDRMIPVIDALEKLGYIEHKQGFYVSDEGYGRQSRMWATSRLWQYFYTHRLREPGFFCVNRPEDVIILRDASKFKKEVGYPNTPKIVRQRTELERYNDFQNDHEITVNLYGSVEIDYRFLVETLYHGIVNKSIVIESVILSTTVLNPTRPYLQIFNPIPYQSIKLSTIPYHSVLPTMTQKKLPESTTVLYLREKRLSVDLMTDYLADLCRHVASIPDMDLTNDYLNDYLSERFPLREIGIKKLDLRLAYEYLHRVYNRESFKLGGRAYGALHQSIPKHLRAYIQINGQPTVELDYSAYHIRMLYHQKGIDYRDDPYEVCEGTDMRDTYKAVGLIAINGDEQEPRKVYGAIRDELKNRGKPLPAGEKPLVRLVNRFRDVHPLIAEYLYKDMGVHLMNKDSKIMNTILMKLMDKGILGLSVYDSVIVAEQHQDYLNQVMFEEYEKEMGFKPKIG